MLSESQKRALETGDIRTNGGMKGRVRQRVRESITDLVYVLNRYKWIEGQNPMGDEIPGEKSAELICNLLYLMDNEYIDENVIHMLLTESQNNWTLPGNEHVHGCSQEMAIDVMMQSLIEIDQDDPMSPDLDELENWEDFQEVLELWGWSLSRVD